ncbi:CPK3 [Symbiodinium sp. CCMP2592]|nr:CPK3 [Symbiodinium sp. CCMP2592]
MQTFAAPPQGGLQEEDFDDLFKAIGLDTGAESEVGMDPTTPLAQPKRKKRNRPVRLEDIQLENETIRSLWTQGLVGQSLNLDAESAQKEFDEDEEPPKLVDYYDVTEAIDGGNAARRVIKKDGSKGTKNMKYCN